MVLTQVVAMVVTVKQTLKPLAIMTQRNYVRLGNPLESAPSAASGMRAECLRCTNQCLSVAKLAMSYQDGPEAFCKAAKKTLSIANERRTKEEMLAAVSQTLQMDDNGISAKIRDLPKPEGFTLLRRDAHAHIVMSNGEIIEESGSSEPDRMRDIHMRLQGTASSNPRDFSKNRSYLVQHGSTYVLNRALLEGDLRWVSDGKRIGPNVADEKRRNYFMSYRQLLAEIAMLNTPTAEATFAAMSGGGTVLGQKACLEHFCRDPNAVKGAGKFALLLAVGALLTLWIIKDARNKSLSFGTLLLVGAGMFLLNNGSKHNYLASQQFGRLTQGPLDGKAVAKLQGLARSKPSAYAHLTSWMDDRTRFRGSSVTADALHELTHPKKSNGKPDPRKAVPEDIARLFVGTNSSDVAYVLKSMQSASRGEGRRIAIEFADANHSSGGATQRELTTLRADPAFAQQIEQPAKNKYELG